MNTWLRATLAGVWCCASSLQAAEEVGPFFEPDFPFFQTAVDLRMADKASPTAANFVVRGILLPQADGSTLVFDQELLRIAGWWKTPAGQPPVSLRGMAQTSYAEPHRKAGADFPKPAGPLLLSASMRPGIAARPEGLLSDPRPSGSPSENGRGPLPADSWRFDGVQLAGATAVLHYRCGEVAVREWHEAREGVVLRHFTVSAHARPLFFNLGVTPKDTWSVTDAQFADAGTISLKTNSPTLALKVAGVELTGELAPSASEQRFTIGFSDHAWEIAKLTPEPPLLTRNQRWAGKVETGGQLDAVRKNGLAFDRVELPLKNPWQRRVRIADLVFLSPDRAVVVTFDGDVWMAEGLAAPNLGNVSWRRFASGLNEPLSIAAVNGVPQVWTRNGLVRLADRDGNGEADWYENFSDAIVQSQSTRAFPLDMDLGPDGSTYVSLGGALNGSNPPLSAGAVSKISPDGRRAEVVSVHGREPYVAVHPRTGMITGSDQQGNYIPSSACYLIRPGDSFGYGEAKPPKLTPPLVWIPHTEDNSCASQTWLLGAGMGALDGKLMHLSYGRGLPFLISPDLDAPVPQGAVISLGLETDFPLLQGRMHPDGASAWVCGFQIYDSRTKTNWGLGRIRLSGQPLTAPVQARSCADGVILTFATPLDAASVKQEHVTATAWNYVRSPQYGSGRFNLSGQAGVEPLPVGQVVLSTDRKSVFVHLPELKPVMQLELYHGFQLAGGAPAEGRVYFTVHQLCPLDLAAAGFPGIDLTRSVAMLPHVEKQVPTALLGKTLSESLGCVACHSVDGSAQGKTGPTWKGLFGKDRIFTDGSIEPANETYLRTSILDPQKKTVKGFQPGMQSYRGVITDDQLESIILYIRSLL